MILKEGSPSVDLSIKKDATGKECRYLTVDHCLEIHRLAARVSLVHVELFDFAIGSALV